MPEQTADALRDGWLVTNDLVYLDADGYVFMLGRSDDIINIGGEKLSPLEVENIASEYEGAGEYACIGIPDPEGLLGQVPVLYVGQCRSDYSAEELRKYLASRMERIKLPARIIELDKLPRNRMEKLDRRAIAALAAQID
jgi:long-chain acyl-CoA synthetase